MSDPTKTSVEPGKGLSPRGCGRWVANCGHSGQPNQEPTTISTTCVCGREVTGTCAGAGCQGKDFYC